LREFRRHGIQVQRVITDKGSAYRSRPLMTCNSYDLI